MSILIKGMKMPTTGVYFVSVDNTGGRDKTVITVERMLGNRDVRQIVGSFELVSVPPHGKCIDVDALELKFREDWFRFDADSIMEYIRENAPTIIQADSEEEEMK